jgi:hypothetical protein
MDKYNDDRTPWGNTPANIKKQIKAAFEAGEPIEFYSNFYREWAACGTPLWAVGAAYRVCPEYVAEKPKAKKKLPKVCTVDKYNKANMAWEDIPAAVKCEIKDAHRDGLDIEYYSKQLREWMVATGPAWAPDTPYRVRPGAKAKPKAKPVVSNYLSIPITICGETATLVLPGATLVALIDAMSTSREGLG